MALTFEQRDQINRTCIDDPSFSMETIREGFGNSPVSGAKIKIHYIGTLEDGKIFDSTYDRKQPFEFTLTRGKKTINLTVV